MDRTNQSKQISLDQSTHVPDSKIIFNRRARLITSDWDVKAREDILNGTGFRITEEGKTDCKTEAGMFSIHSPLYGTDYHNEHAFEDRYSCECGEYTGKNFEGKVCPKCGKKVQFIDVDMSITGWIILDKDVIINTIYYKKIRSFIGTKIFPDIIKYKELVDREQTAANPFDGIGMIEFHDRFSEIMNFYLKRNGSNPKKRDMYHFIMVHAEQVFAHAIPVYSSHLRPFVIRAEEIKYTDDDKLYRKIFTNSKMLNDRYELERRVEIAKKRKRHTAQYLRRENILYAIQIDLDKLWELSFDMVKKKEGIIRNKILGGRLTKMFGRLKTYLMAGTSCIHTIYETRVVTRLVAMGNSKGIVKRIVSWIIDAAKYLTTMRYGLNDYGKLDNHADRNIKMIAVL